MGIIFTPQTYPNNSKAPGSVSRTGSFAAYICKLQYLSILKAEHSNWRKQQGHQF